MMIKILLLFLLELWAIAFYQGTRERVARQPLDFSPDNCTCKHPRTGGRYGLTGADKRFIYRPASEVAVVMSLSG